jgi:hypothetical protein
MEKVRAVKNPIIPGRGVCDLQNKVGTHSLYFVFRGSDSNSDLLHLDWFKLI